MAEAIEHKYAVLGDIGGTNARLELSRIGRDAKYSDVVKNVFYVTNDYKEGLPAVLEDFLKEFKGTHKYPVIGVIAVACPVDDNKAEKFANSIWPSIDGDEIAKQFNLEALILLNDFVAVGHALSKVEDKDTTIINEGANNPNGIRCAVGPGTGLGVAFVTHQKDSHDVICPQVYPVEAAHAVFSAQDQEEEEWARFFLKKNPHWTYFHIEQGFSGPSIPFMYQFYAEKDGKPDVGKMSGKEIFDLARANSDPYAVKALNLFFKIYAEFVSNWSLSLMPHGGIYLVGGLTVSLKDLIAKDDSVFKKNYYNKDFLNSKLKNIPIKVVHEVELGLLGCFALAQKELDLLSKTKPEN